MSITIPDRCPDCGGENRHGGHAKDCKGMAVWREAQRIAREGVPVRIISTPSGSSRDPIPRPQA